MTVKLMLLAEVLRAVAIVDMAGKYILPVRGEKKAAREAAVTIACFWRVVKME